MDEDVITDLKQFIVAAARQELHDVAHKSDLEKFATKEDVAMLVGDAKTEILDAIGDAMDANTDEQIADLHRQFAALSPKAA